MGTWLIKPIAPILTNPIAQTNLSYSSIPNIPNIPFNRKNRIKSYFF